MPDVVFLDRRRRTEIVDSAENGAPEEIRTPNLLIRSQMLYPIELRARMSRPGWPAIGCIREGRKASSRRRGPPSSRGRNLADRTCTCKGSGWVAARRRNPPAKDRKGDV